MIHAGGLRHPARPDRRPRAFQRPRTGRTAGLGSGTRTLVAGVSTLLPRRHAAELRPSDARRRSVEAKLAAARGSAHVDLALWGGLVPGSIGHMDELATAASSIPPSAQPVRGPRPSRPDRAHALRGGRTVAIDARAWWASRGGASCGLRTGCPGRACRRGRARTALARGSAPAARPRHPEARPIAGGTDLDGGGAQRRARPARCPARPRARAGAARLALRGRRAARRERRSRTPRRAARRSPRPCPHSQPQLAPSARRRYATAARSGSLRTGSPAGDSPAPAADRGCARRAGPRPGARGRCRSPSSCWAPSARHSPPDELVVAVRVPSVRMPRRRS